MIGVFDSGVGGLTIIKELFKKLPSYDVMYFADLARSPYGTKSKKTIEKFAKEITKFLIGRGAKIIIVACNTASAQAFDSLKKDFNIPIFNVITPAVEEASKVTRNKRIGIIGTRGTIQSKVYEKSFKELKKDNFQIFTKACPLLVPLVEENFVYRPETKRITRFYLRELKDRQIDTLVLGCTHYPLLKKVIDEVMGKKVVLVDSTKVVERISSLIEKDKALGNSLSKNHKYIYFTSDVPNNFKEIAEGFLGRKTSEPTLINLENLYEQ